MKNANARPFIIIGSIIIIVVVLLQRFSQMPGSTGYNLVFNAKTENDCVGRCSVYMHNWNCSDKTTTFTISKDINTSKIMKFMNYTYTCRCNLYGC